MGDVGPRHAARDRTVTVNGVELHYRVWGDPSSPPLLLLHAGGCHAHWWNAVAANFSVRYHVIAPDLRGHGDSGRSPTGDYTFETYASDVAALVETLELDDVRIAGHSLGGYVGLVYASQGPPRLRALVVADMLCELDGPALDRTRDAAGKPAPTFASRQEAEARFRLLPPDTVAPPDVLAALAAEAVTAMPDGRFTFKFDRRAMNHPPLQAWTLAPLVACPTLVVRGEWSTLMPRHHAERLVTSLPIGRFHEISGAYHHVMLDRLDAFVDVLDDFLAVTW